MNFHFPWFHIFRSPVNTTGIHRVSLWHVHLPRVFFLSKHYSIWRCMQTLKMIHFYFLKTLLLCKHITSQFTVALKMLSRLAGFANSWEHGRLSERNEFVHRKIQSCHIASFTKRNFNAKRVRFLTCMGAPRIAAQKFRFQCGVLGMILTRVMGVSTFKL